MPGLESPGFESPKDTAAEDDIYSSDEESAEVGRGATHSDLVDDKVTQITN